METALHAAATDLNTDAEQLLERLRSHNLTVCLLGEEGPVEAADRRVLKSRVDAYRLTCAIQGKKLLEIDKTLCLSDVAQRPDTPLHLVQCPNAFLETIRKIVLRKEH